MIAPGTFVSHRHNPDLGPGRVLGLVDRRLVVEFPDAGQTLHLAASSDVLVPLELSVGSRARLAESGEMVVLAATEGAGRWRLADGRRVAAEELWPLPQNASPLDRLAAGRIDALEDFRNRVDALRLARLREADGLGSFLGGRIQLFPHQLYAAERACHSDPVRWLLADEVGLGKTVEACLIMNRLLHTGRAERTLVVAPETLTLQWLGELWRKHHQVFVLLDSRRLADVARDHGASSNPFEVHPRAIVSLEVLVERPRLVEQAVAAGVDLVVVDEAHHLRRPAGQPGNAAYRAVAPLAGLGRHLLLLTATPLEEDAHGFFRLLQLLRPEEFPEDETFAQRLERRQPLPPCTSAARRVDVGGLPPREAQPVDFDVAAWSLLQGLEDRVRALPAPGPLEHRRKAEQVRRAMASPAALAALLPRGDALAEAAMGLLAGHGEADPRLRWLGEQAGAWARGQEKTLVFVAHRETLEVVKRALEWHGRVRVGVFHEQLSAERRDVEVAQFRLAEGPAVLVSTECGGEGRNFEFCRRLVLFDLPWHPGVVEQRIGRLDRIGRTRPTEIVYFRPPSGLGCTVVALYERLGLFREPLGGLVRELDHIAREIEQIAVDGPREVPPEAFEAVLAEAQEGHDRVQQAACHELHRDPYHQGLAAGILERVPAELEILTADVVLRAAARFGFEAEAQSGRGVWLIELGNDALVDQLPGVPAGARFLGTFDREEAVERETLDFFASGHPLVEGVLAELADGPRGRVALLQLDGSEETFGLLALYKHGARLDALVVDNKGRHRPDLVAELLARELRPQRIEARRWTAQPGWRRTIERLAEQLPKGERPQAVAFFRLRPAAG